MAGRSQGYGALGGRTTRQLLTAGVCLALAVLAALGAAAVLVLSRASSISGALLDRQMPAIAASESLANSLVNQETGVRGYGITGQRDFLAPYTDGLRQQRQAVARLHALLPSGSAGRRDVDAVLERAEVWQRRIARPVAAAPPGARVAVAARRAGEGKTDFDAIRTGLARQQADLQARVNRTRATLEHVDAERDLVFALAGLVVLGLAVLVFAGLRRGVTGPLERLSHDVRLVSRGEFDHRVAGSGPADVRRLAADVDTMRTRLAQELAFTHHARDLLDEQAADLRRSNAELEQFAYVASHDLQEPLRKVASFCQLLERRYADQLDDRARQYIGFAVDGANRMQGLINDLLEFSRVGRLHTDHVPVDLEAVLRGTEESLSIAVEEAGATVTHDPLPTVPGDATQLGVVLQNLLSNAIKFRSPERPVAVHVGVRGRGPVWELSVSDNGIGIEAAYAEKVFVIFQRLHTRETYPGNGIGLALCKKIVEYHGGTIAVDPEHGPGTRFVFTLPALEEQPPPADGPPALPTGRDEDARGAVRSGDASADGSGEGSSPGHAEPGSDAAARS